MWFKMKKFTKKEEKEFNFKINQIKDELKTNRHILACLGSVGISFDSDLNRFKDYLKEKRLKPYLEQEKL
jgi:hypothetical protein